MGEEKNQPVAALEEGLDDLREKRELLERTTSLGCKLKDIRLQNGHCLVLKVRSATTSKGGIELPDTFTKKSVGNLKALKGVILSASQPYRRHSKYRKVEFSHAYGESIWRSHPRKCGGMSVFASAECPPAVTDGDAVVYNSYNVGKIQVDGCEEDVCIVRECDILCRFPAEKIDDVNLSDFAV